MNLDLKGIEELVGDKLKIADIFRYPINSGKEIATIREYFFNHESIELKIEYKHPTYDLGEMGKIYCYFFREGGNLNE